MWTVFVSVMIAWSVFLRVVAIWFGDSQRFRVGRTGHQSLKPALLATKMKVVQNHLLGVSMVILCLEKIYNEQDSATLRKLAGM
jgi:hypothetical protein